MGQRERAAYHLPEPALNKFPPLPLCSSQLQTAPVDFRFPIQNQSRHCYVAVRRWSFGWGWTVHLLGMGPAATHHPDSSRKDWFERATFPTLTHPLWYRAQYCEAHRCFQTKGEDSTDCQRLAKVYRSICPVEWLAQWNEARENGTWCVRVWVDASCRARGCLVHSSG